jgi:hypothetical protein
MFLTKLLLSSFLLVMSLCPALAQEGTVRQHVYLRSDPSTTNPPIGTLRKGTTVTLLEAAPKEGFYHVKTMRGKEGWVGARYLAAGVQGGTAELAAPLSGASGCDATLWDHVYNPQRLIVKQKCIQVTGTIVDATNGKRRDGVRQEADGDTHGWLEFDPQFTNLLNAGNMSDEGGNLVYEIVCEFKVSQADAKEACSLTYHTPVQLPLWGHTCRSSDHTFRTQTTHNGWKSIL